MTTNRYRLQNLLQVNFFSLINGELLLLYSFLICSTVLPVLNFTSTKFLWDKDISKLIKMKWDKYFIMDKKNMRYLTTKGGSLITREKKKKRVVNHF